MRWLLGLLLAVIPAFAVAYASVPLTVGGGVLQQGTDADLTLPFDGAATVTYDANPGDTSRIIQVNVEFGLNGGDSSQDFHIWLHIFDGFGGLVFSDVESGQTINPFFPTTVDFFLGVPGVPIADIGEVVVSVCEDLGGATAPTECGRRS